MAANLSNDDEMIQGINVTPLVDVVLVLLVIFMITAPAIYQSALKVELPKASSGENSEHVTLKFSLTKDGTIYLGSELVKPDQVPQIVKQALNKDSSANAVVSADASLTHGKVVEFIDQLKTEGLTKFAVGVASPQKK